jgi:hypothetical protein
VLTTLVRAGSELGWTRMDLAFLLGSAFAENRTRAKAYGDICHFVLDLLFAFAYTALFVVGESSWRLGAVAGALHALFVSTVLVNVLLPVVHPRMGTPDTAANEVTPIEPPGFLTLNFGRNTFVLNFVADVACGAIVGATVSVR